MLIEKPYRIAIIEDESEQVDYYKRVLDRIATIRPRYFNNASDGLSFIRDFQVKIVISDIGLPDMHGDELLRECIKLNQGISFYAITGKDSLITADTCMLEGARGFLQKPVEPDQIRSIVEKAVQHLDTWNQLIRSIAAKKKKPA